jgi:simple sugar transport system ATP-binding protein
MYMNELIKMKALCKNFGEIVALENVDFHLNANEVVGLLGDNGAGKSTLIKILTGVYPFDKGELFIKGNNIDPQKYSVRTAREFGIETVYQESSLGEKQPLWRNVFIGRHRTNWLGYIKVKQEKDETIDVLKRLIGLKGVGISPDAFVGTLSGGERQGIAIGRAMYFQSEIIVLDEPTTALSLKEVEKVLAFINMIKKNGKSCIYITHNIFHIYSVSDRFVILDRGKIVGNYRREELSVEELSEKLMVHARRE